MYSFVCVQSNYPGQQLFCILKSSLSAILQSLFVFLFDASACLTACAAFHTCSGPAESLYASAESFALHASRRRGLPEFSLSFTAPQLFFF